MEIIKIPEFDERGARLFRENDYSTVLSIHGADVEIAEKYALALTNAGYSVRESRRDSISYYAALTNGTSGVFINLFFGVAEMLVVFEESTPYFDYSDTGARGNLPVTVSQIKLEDYGMSYVIRLSDGRFIIIDGGWDYEPDADSLFKNLSSSAAGRPIVIAAWIFTHAHCDHFHCFIPFYDKYGDRVKIEKFLYNFPRHDDLEHFPTLANQDVRVGDCSALTNIPRMEERVYKSGASVYRPHTGQGYVIGDARIRILSSMDDTVLVTQNVNAQSLVFRMEIAGQIILWTGDASFSDTRLAEKYGDTLRADILQIPHHGFGSGRAQGEIDGYDLIRPEVCMVASTDLNIFHEFGPFRGGTYHVMRRVGIKELITGDENRTITLPYHAAVHGADRLARRLELGLESCGANTWIFSELSTANPEDLVFTLVNPANAPTRVTVDIFFEERDMDIAQIEIPLSRECVRTLSIVGDEVEADLYYYNGKSLARRGVPENAAFAVRFIAKTPIVVSNKNHAAAYHSGADVIR